MSPVPDQKPKNDNKPLQAATEDLPQVINVQSSSDSDQETEAGFDASGYQLLPQEPNNLYSAVSQDEVEDNDGRGDVGDGIAHASDATSDISPIDQVLLRHIDSDDLAVGCTGSGMPTDEELNSEDRKEGVWAAPRMREDLEIKPEVANQIRDAMSNFSLPSNHTPDWAKSVPEETWKKNLLAKLNKNSNPSE